MFMKQLSIFVENRQGTLVELLNVLKTNGINIRALSMADTADFGVLRMLVEDTEKAMQEIKNAGYVVKSSDVLVMLMDDKPGGLLRVANLLSDHGLNIEYVYAFASNPTGQARFVCKIDDNDKARRVLTEDAQLAELLQTKESLW